MKNYSSIPQKQNQAFVHGHIMTCLRWWVNSRCQFYGCSKMQCLQCIAHGDWRVLIMQSYTSQTDYRSLLLLETKEHHDHSRHMSRERQGQRLCRPLYCNHRKTWMRVLDSHHLCLFLSSIDWNYSWNDAQTASLCCSHRYCSLWTRVVSYIYYYYSYYFCLQNSNQLKLSVLCINMKILIFNIVFIIHI